MDERLFARLAELVRAGPVVLASVLETRGATPRKRGSRMLISAQGEEFSIGGGLAEARVIAAAQALLAGDGPHSTVAIDLSGQPGAAGICGGSMRLGLRRWDGEADRARAARIGRSLQDGERIVLEADDLGDPAMSARNVAVPDPRLLIVGAGHCGLALYELARHLAFDIWVHDTRAACFSEARFGAARCLCGDTDLLIEALQSGRDVYAVLLNRDFQSDVAALRVLCRQPPAMLAMMGSRRRIAQVRAALPEYESALRDLVAPVGLAIGAETPQEIAISILAQLIQRRSGTV